MKHSHKIFILFLSIGVFSCNYTVDKGKNSLDDIITVDSIPVDLNEIVIETEIDNQCPRGRAEPIIKKERYPNTTFTLQSDSLTAIETIVFDNGDELIIRNWGCDYYVLTFRFITSKYKNDTANLPYWYKSAGRLITEVLAGIDTPMDIKRGLVFLESYYLRDQKNDFKNVKIGEEIDFDESEIRSYVTLERIEKLSENQFAVTVSYATGPL